MSCGAALCERGAGLDTARQLACVAAPRFTDMGAAPRCACSRQSAHLGAVHEETHRVSATMSRMAEDIH